MPFIPIYKIYLSELPGAPHNPEAAKKKKSEKFLLRFKANNYSDVLGTMDLLIYKATDHNHYGYNSDVFTIQQDGSQSPKELSVNNLVIGNLDIQLAYFATGNPLKYIFHYLTLTPEFTTINNENYLYFKVKAFTKDHKEIKPTGITVSLNNPGDHDANPSPPRDPA